MSILYRARLPAADDHCRSKHKWEVYLIKRLTIFACAAGFTVIGTVMAGATPAPKDAKVYFINLKDGDKVKSPFKVQFGLSGIGVAPVGVEKENTGHHHLIIDTEVTGAALNEPLVADDK